MNTLPLTTPPAREHEVFVTAPNAPKLTLHARSSSRGKAVESAIRAFRNRHPEVPANVQLSVQVGRSSDVS